MVQDDKTQSEYILDFIFDEFFHELLDKFKKNSLKNKDLKLKNQSLLKEKKRDFIK